MWESDLVNRFSTSSFGEGVVVEKLNTLNPLVKTCKVRHNPEFLTKHRRKSLFSVYDLTVDNGGMENIIKCLHPLEIHPS